MTKCNLVPIMYMCMCRLNPLSLMEIVQVISQEITGESNRFSLCVTMVMVTMAMQPWWVAMVMNILTQLQMLLKPLPSWRTSKRR